MKQTLVTLSPQQINLVDHSLTGLERGSVVLY